MSFLKVPEEDEGDVKFEWQRGAPREAYVPKWLKDRRRHTALKLLNFFTAKPFSFFFLLQVCQEFGHWSPGSALWDCCKPVMLLILSCSMCCFGTNFILLSQAWKNEKNPWGIDPQTFRFHSPMLYHWATETPWWARHTSSITLGSAMSDYFLCPTLVTRKDEKHLSLFLYQAQNLSSFLFLTNFIL